MITPSKPTTPSDNTTRADAIKGTLADERVIIGSRGRGRASSGSGPAGGGVSGCTGNGKDNKQGNKMGAIDPVVARNYAKIKSASIEANNRPTNVTRSTSNQYEYDEIVSSMEAGRELQRRQQVQFVDNLRDDNQKRAKDRDGNNNSNSPINTINESFQQKAIKLLTLTPGASLKPSVSTSCLLTADDATANSSSSSLVCIPTRASLTHEWKKLKTPNKCRECNLLVYFNGRECSFCGFVAHKKCVTILVIKCSGQQLAKATKSKVKLTERQSSISDSLSLSAVAAANYIIQRGQTNTNQQSQRKGKQLTVQPIFGQPISDLDRHHVIDFVRRFVYEIDTRGLTLKGIYRVSSIKSKVDRLCNYYDQNITSLVDLSSFHPNIVANALKMYLRKLPEPLLTHELYDQFIDMAKKYSSSNAPTQSTNNLNSFTTNPNAAPIRQRKIYTLTVTSTPTSVNGNPNYNPMLIVELREIIDLLPEINRDLIAIIMRHLRRVANMSSENQMSATNLSIIFGPTLLSSENKSLAIVDNVHQARAVELMITWADQIFPQYDNYESRAVIELDVPDEDYLDRLSGASKSPIKQSRIKDGRKVQLNEANDLSPQPPASPTSTSKTREDLNELRRQFFTIPTIQTNLVPSDQAAERPAEAKHLESRKAKPFKPPGSVPVVKVQPSFCKTLSKLGGSKP